MRMNSDESLRVLERASLEGDPVASVRFEAALARHGFPTRKTLAELLFHEGAPLREVAESIEDPDRISHNAWESGTRRLLKAAPLRVIAAGLQSVLKAEGINSIKVSPLGWSALKLTGQFKDAYEAKRLLGVFEYRGGLPALLKSAFREPEEQVSGFLQPFAKNIIEGNAIRSTPRITLPARLWATFLNSFERARVSRSRSVTRRNSDEDLRALERRWRSTKAEEDRQRYFRAAARAGIFPAREWRAEQIAEHGRRQSRFEKFVSWTRFYELLTAQEPRGETSAFDVDCWSWAEQATKGSGFVPRTIRQLESEYNTRLDEDQRREVRTVWERAHEAACYKSATEAMRRLVPRIVEVLNNSDGSPCEEELDRRGVPRRPRLPLAVSRSGREFAVVGWREGVNEAGEEGVLFRLSRAFLRPWTAGMFWISASCVDGNLRAISGSDVVMTALRLADAAGDRRYLALNYDPELEVEDPSDEDFLSQIRDYAGPLAPKEDGGSVNDEDDLDEDDS